MVNTPVSSRKMDIDVKRIGWRFYTGRIFINGQESLFVGPRRSVRAKLVRTMNGY